MRQNLALLLAVALLLACLSLPGCDAGPTRNALPFQGTAVLRTSTGTLHEINYRGKVYLTLHSTYNEYTAVTKLDEWAEAAPAKAAP